MGARHWAAVSALNLAVMGLNTPAAFADTPTESSPYPPPNPSIHLIGDGRPQAGDAIGVSVGCDGEVGHPHSPALVLGELSESDTPADITTYRTSGTIVDTAEPGDYPLVVRCDGERLDTTFTVYPPDSGDEELPGGGSGDTPAQDEADQVSLTPRGAPETGGGPRPTPALWIAALGGWALGWVSGHARRASRR